MVGARGLLYAVHMTLVEVVSLALVQGLTEFLPISSSGHLVAARHLFGVTTDHTVAFDAFLHLGTLVAVLLYFWRVWWRLLRGLGRSDSEGRTQRSLLYILVVATLPAAVVGYFFANAFTRSVNHPRLLAVELLATALILWLSDQLRRPGRPGWPTSQASLFIGLAQVLALFPGLSRSGITIAAGRWQGLTREDATTFSFLMSAPIIGGTGLVKLFELWQANLAHPWYLIVGFAVSCLSGLLAIGWLIRLLKHHSFLPFVVYLILVAGVLFYVS